MITLMDWLVEIEQLRTSLSRNGQERMAQMEYSSQKVTQTAKIETIRPAAQAIATAVQRCPETIG